MNCLDAVRLCVVVAAAVETCFHSLLVSYGGTRAFDAESDNGLRRVREWIQLSEESWEISGSIREYSRNRQRVSYDKWVLDLGANIRLSHTDLPQTVGSEDA